MAKKAPKIYFSFHLTALRIVGINIFQIPNPILRMLYNLYAIAFVVVSFLAFTIFELLAIIDNRKDLDRVTFIGSYWISHFMGCLKGAIFLLNKAKIKKYLMTFEEGVFIPDLNRGGQKEIYIIERAITVSNIQASFFWFMAGVIIVNRVIYACLDAGVMETEYDPVTNITTTILARTLPWYSYIWFDTRPTPNYQIAYLYQVWCMGIFGVLIGVLDTLVSGMLVHLNAQFSILNNAVLTVTERAQRGALEEQDKHSLIGVNICKMTNATMGLDEGWEVIPKNDPNMSKHLDICVSNCLKHHVKIIELSNNVEDQFNLMVLVQILGSTILFCFQLFQLSYMTLFSPKFLNMLSYLVLMLFQLSIYCYNGNEISLQSEEISTAAYNTDWFAAEDSVKKNLILMMVRAQRPIKMSAGKFAFLSLATFMSIVRGSISYYMVLHRMNG